MSSEVQAAVTETKPNDREYNFRQLEKSLNEERQAKMREIGAREELEKEIVKLRAQHQNTTKDDDDDDSEPYVDHKRLNKTLSKFGQNTQTEIQKAMELAKKNAKDELRQEMWIENNPDFFDVLQKHADKLPIVAPKLADSILNMPDSFERQKLVYNNIKALGLDKPEQKQSSVQDQIDANKKSLYYQPSGPGAPPYASVGDFSAQGKKQAFEKMQELKNRLRI